MDNRDCGGVMANWFVAMTRLSGSAGFGVDYNDACCRGDPLGAAADRANLKFSVVIRSALSAPDPSAYADQHE